MSSAGFQTAIRAIKRPPTHASFLFMLISSFSRKYQIKCRKDLINYRRGLAYADEFWGLYRQTARMVRDSERRDAEREAIFVPKVTNYLAFEQNLLVPFLLRDRNFWHRIPKTFVIVMIRIQI
jgi:hypothetical protein